mmetsp:Transcript_18972/g.57357  ORF Transcript_18972/g.57357 Transcript_18972/m.57357 type:complete len:92 (+) Transcript_18972:2719-2994(+)
MLPAAMARVVLDDGASRRVETTLPPSKPFLVRLLVRGMFAGGFNGVSAHVPRPSISGSRRLIKCSFILIPTRLHSLHPHSHHPPLPFLPSR